MFRKDLMLTQVMPYCNQAPHTIFKIKCEELYFKRCEGIKFLENDAFHLPSSDVGRSCVKISIYLSESNGIIDMKIKC